MDILKSVLLFVCGTLKRIQWYLPPLLLDPFDAVERLFGINYPVPQWLAWALFGMGWFMAFVMTYHEMRLQKISLEKQLIEVKEEFYFEPTGVSVTTKTGEVLINATFRAKPSVLVQELRLEINGTRIAPLGEKPFAVSPQYTDVWSFKLAGKVKEGEVYKGKLIATIDTKEHESREFDVYT